MFLTLWRIFFILALPFLTNLESKPTRLQLPLDFPEVKWHPLLETVNQELQHELESQLFKNKRWKRLVAKKKMAVALVDLTFPYSPRYASVNGDEMMYAASLPKIAVLLATCQAIEEGVVEETSEVINDATNMIRFSSNSAATRLIDLLGFEKIASVLRDDHLKLYDPEHGGGLWVGRRYAKSSTRYPDPLEGLSHAATVNQVSRFYYLLAYGKLINPQRCAEMLNILSNPGIIHKFVYSLKLLDPEARLFRKSGTWRNWHSDSVLVWSEYGRRYILVGMVENPRGEQILRDLVPVAETVLYH